MVAPSRVNNVTVEQIEESLIEIAAHNEHSSAEVRAARKSPRCDTIKVLGNLYERLRSREAKWLTSIILKDFGGIKLPDSFQLNMSLSGLPHCVQVQATFQSSMPEGERRDGPGRLRLGYSLNLPITPPTTAPEAVALVPPPDPFWCSPKRDGTSRSVALLEGHNSRSRRDSTTTSLTSFNKFQHSPLRQSIRLKQTSPKVPSHSGHKTHSSPTFRVVTSGTSLKSSPGFLRELDIDARNDKSRSPRARILKWRNAAISDLAGDRALNSQPSVLSPANGRTPKRTRTSSMSQGSPNYCPPKRISTEG